MLKTACIAASLLATATGDLVVDLQGDGLHKTLNFAVSIVDLPLDQGEGKCVGRIALDLGNSFYVDPEELRNIENARHGSGDDSAWLYTHSGLVDIEKGEFTYERAITNSMYSTTPIVTFTAFFTEGWLNISFPIHIRYPNIHSLGADDAAHAVRCFGLYVYASCRGLPAGGLRAFSTRRISGLPPRPQPPPNVAGVASYAPENPKYSSAYSDVVYPIIVLPTPFAEGFFVPGRVPDVVPRVDAALTYQEYYHLLSASPPKTTNPRLTAIAKGNQRTLTLLSQCGVAPSVSAKMKSSADTVALSVVIASSIMIFVSLWV